MVSNKLVEHVFFFGLLAGVAFLLWKIISPFAATLAFAAILVTICFPIYEQILKRIPKHNTSIAATLSVLVVIAIVVAPLTLLGSVLLKEAVSIYTMFNVGNQMSLQNSVAIVEQFFSNSVPGFSIDIGGYVSQVAASTVQNIGGIFAGTASTIFLFFISLVSTFYFFRDGKIFTSMLVRISPLPDNQDEKILGRLATAVRSVAVGSVLVALIQGCLTGLGLWIFGFDRAILWGSIAAIGALVPGVGTVVVFIPAVLFSIVTGSYVTAIGVALWGALAVGFIDNLLGPYLMSRGNKMHPFLILLSVLGGMLLFGPIGFIIGPVVTSLFIVLLELYSMHISTNAPESITQRSKTKKT
ncbi:AI-2E family transporter [Candidatus Kaiserbacteria bacterium]|nr:AI-2E family transporter [Candidatus Kaiserbacteria bacterium]